jgi:biopolymer transport protein TolR
MRGGRARKFKFEINVVPYVDVMLVLVVILMVAVPMANPSIVDLPNAGPSKKVPTDYLEIVIKADGSLSVGKHSDTKSMTTPSKDRNALAQQLNALHAAEPELPLLVAADKEVKYDEVVQMIATAKKAGVARVGLAVR